ncbi:MAG: hypothetical protein GIW95_00075, partial [Candidatus Eremiobacteraeota bacterium]|nr:hypothetical protein [Candidatus Eremiobacteraeota bacterium]
GMKSPYGAAIGCSPPIPSSPPAPPADCPNAIYVANYGSNNIAILDASTHAQLGTISGSGVNGPVSVAYDRIKQQLYVGNWNDDTVGVFNAATNVKMGILSGNGIDAPYGVGVGNEGRLYVANLDAQGGKGISRFDTNNQFAALPALTSTPYAGGIAVGVNKVFASNYFNNTIAIFDPTNNDAYIGSISGNGLNKPFGLAAVGLNVYAANNGANTLSEFDQTTLGFVRTVSGNSLNSPYGMAFNATDMFAANGNSTISDFSATSGAAFGVLAGSSINQTYGVAAGRSCGVLKKTMDFRRSLGNAKAPLLEREISSHGFAASAT